MEIKIESIPTPLIIGDEYRETNEIEFKIVLEANGEACWLKLLVPVGSLGLLRNPEDANTMEVRYAIGQNAQELANVIVPDEGKGDDTRKWWLGDSQDGVQVNGKTELSVSIKNVLCRADAGDSKITVEWQPETEPDPIFLDLEIKKSKPEKAKSSILYFIAEPTSLIGGGTVKLHWDIVGDQSATLETPTRTGWKGKPPVEEKLNGPFTFTLRVGTQEKQVTVNVLARDRWHEISLSDDKFPSAIFPPQKTDDALYAVFISAKKAGGAATLYKSADGITNWQAVSDLLPDGMESSPGIRLGGRLWLIGGSAVDSEQKSNRICYYDLSDHRWHESTVVYSDPKVKFEERMGHACVAVNDNTIWVLGGLGPFGCVNDVWSFTLDPKDRTCLNASRLFESSGWSPRCMFSAVYFNRMIWVLGGVDSPNGNPLGDIWAMTPGKAWEKRLLEAGKEYVVANSISTGADTCDGTLFAVAQKLGEEPKMSKLLNEGVTSTSDSWMEGTDDFHSLPDNWMLTPNSAVVVGFQNGLYLRYLHRNAMHGVPARSNHPGAPLFVYIAE